MAQFDHVTRDMLTLYLLDTIYEGHGACQRHRADTRRTTNYLHVWLRRRANKSRLVQRAIAPSSGDYIYKTNEAKTTVDVFRQMALVTVNGEQM
jgi:hypothetical protein